MKKYIGRVVMVGVLLVINAAPTVAAGNKESAQKEVQAINSSLYKLVKKTTAPSKPTKKKTVDTGVLSVNLWPVIAGQFALDDHVNHPAVQAQVKWYLKHMKLLNRMLNRATPYLYYVHQQIQQRGMPAEFSLLPMVESEYAPQAYSSAGAAGLWQLMPGTAASLGLDINWWYDARRDVVVSTQASLNYLATLNSVLHDWQLTAAAYNMGIGAIQSKIRNRQELVKGPVSYWHLDLPEETERYIPKLLALAQIIKHAQHYGVELPYVPARPYFTPVVLNTQIDIAAVSHLSGAPEREIQALNPGLRRWATDPSGIYHLVLPIASLQRFKHNYAKISGHTHTTWQYHEVRRGESLKNIARIYHTTEKLIRKVNFMSSSRITEGEGLIVPVKLNSIYGSLMPAVCVQKQIKKTPVHLLLHASSQQMKAVKEQSNTGSATVNQQSAAVPGHQAEAQAPLKSPGPDLRSLLHRIYQ